MQSWTLTPPQKVIYKKFMGKERVVNYLGFFHICEMNFLKSHGKQARKSKREDKSKRRINGLECDALHSHYNSFFG